MMADPLEIRRIIFTIEKEKEMIKLFKDSTTEIEDTLNEMEKTHASIDGENSEWKTRMEIQAEINEQLKKNIATLQEKIAASKQQVKDVQSAVRTSAIHSDAANVTPYLIKMLERDRDVLVGERTELDWRIDQEAKAHHLALEERGRCQVEFSSAQSGINEIKTKVQKDNDALTSRSISSRKGMTGFRNIPQDQRILDLKKGPIRRTAAVKTLPALERNS